MVALQYLRERIKESQSEHNSNFPPGDLYKTAHESIIYETHYDGVLHYDEINQFGLIFNKQGLWMNDNEKKFDLFEISKLVKDVLTYSLNFYEKVGYHGLMLINLSLEGIKDGLLIQSKRNYDTYRESLGLSFDDSISIERKITVSELSESFDEIVKNVFNELLWSFGVDKDYQRKELVDKMYKK